MEQIVYTSRASAQATPADLFNIIEVSARNNPDREVTGFLIASEGAFLQLIEGPSDRLEQLLSTLKRDPRHHEMGILLRHAIDGRNFPNWRMKRFDTFGGNTGDILAVLHDRHLPPKVLSAVEGFLQRQRKAA